MVYPFFGNAQNELKNELISNAQKEYGTDNILVFGKMYFPAHYGVEDHQFYITPVIGKGLFISQEKLSRMLI